jgi:hypothetical protein
LPRKLIMIVIIDMRGQRLRRFPPLPRHPPSDVRAGPWRLLQRRRQRRPAAVLFGLRSPHHLHFALR